MAATAEAMGAEAARRVVTTAGAREKAAPQEGGLADLAGVVGPLAAVARVAERVGLEEKEEQSVGLAAAEGTVVVVTREAERREAPAGSAVERAVMEEAEAEGVEDRPPQRLLPGATSSTHPTCASPTCR